MRTKITLQIALLSSLFIFNFLTSFGQSNDWYWGRGHGGNGDDAFYSPPLAVDNIGNVYMTGNFSYSAIFNSDTLNGNASNAYLVKYDTSGNLLWVAQSIDSLIYNAGSRSGSSAVAVDQKGNVYITGYGETVTFGGITLRGGSVFLVKYSSNGNVIWVKSSGGKSGGSESIATDDSDNVFITGSIWDTTASFGSFNLTPPKGGGCVFIVKYDANGNVLWAKQGNAPSAACYADGYSVACDNLGNAFITGFFEDTISFGSTTLISNYSTWHSSGFITKYSSSGNVLWAKQSSNLNTNSSASGYAVVCDQNNNAYITGDFRDTVQFGYHELKSPSTDYSAFISKYDSAGNVIWAKQTSPGWMGSTLASDKMGHIYFQGQSADYIQSLKYMNYRDSIPFRVNSASFLLELNTFGNPICGSVINNTWDNDNKAGGVATDYSGHYVYECGTSGDTTIFASDILSRGAIFLGRWKTCEENSLSSGTTVLHISPNPSSGRFIVKTVNNASIFSIEVYNILGQSILTQYAGNSIQYQLDLSNKANGIYFCRVKSENGEIVGVGKIIVER